MKLGFASGPSNALLHYEWCFTFTGYESLQCIITLWMTFYFYWLWVFATHYYTMNDVLLLLVMSLCNALLHYEWRFTFYWVWGPFNALLHYEWHFTFDWVWGPFNVWGPLHYEWRFTFDLVWVPEAQLNWNCSEIEEPVRFFQREGA